MPQGVRLASPPKSLGDVVGADEGWVKKILDFIGPKDDLGVTPAAIIDPSTPIKLISGGLKGPLKPQNLKANWDDLINKMRTFLPSSVSEPLREWTNAAQIDARDLAVRRVQADPDLLSKIQGLVGQKLGPEFPVYRGTNRLPSQSPFPNVISPRSYSLSPAQGVKFAHGGPPQNASLIKGIGTPEATLLPGARVEHELIMDPTAFKGVPRVTTNPNAGQVPPVNLAKMESGGIGQLPMHKGQSSQAGQHWFGEGYTGGAGEMDSYIQKSNMIDPTYADSLKPTYGNPKVAAYNDQYQLFKPIYDKLAKAHLSAQMSTEDWLKALDKLYKQFPLIGK